MMEIEMNAELEKDAGSETSHSSSNGSSAGSTFCTLEQDFAKVINAMKANPALTTFEGEYTRLFEALYETHRNKEDLTKRCTELEEELVKSTQKIYALERNAEADVEHVATLKQELVSIMKLADAAHSREQNAQEVIENLRLSITKLNDEIEQKNRQLGMDEESVVSKQKEGLLKERERLMGEMKTMKQRMNNVTIYAEELERKTSAVDHQINEMQEKLDTQLNEFSKEHRAREMAESEIQQLQEELKAKNNDLQAANLAAKTATNNVLKLENQLREQKAINEKMQKEINKLMLKRMNLQAELDNANVQIDESTKDATERNKELRNLMQDANRLKEDLSKCKTEKEWAMKKFFKVDNIRVKLEQESTQWRIGLKNAETEVDVLKKQLDAEQKKIETLMREKELTTRSIVGLKETIKKMNMELALREQSKRKIESDYLDTMQTIGTLKKNMQIVEKDRDKYSLEVQELAQQVEERLDEIKLKQVEIFDYKKRLVEVEAKYKQQQNLFEAVRADRNTCSKSLIEAQDEIQELRSKLKIMGHQIEQLKEDIATKEASLVKEEFLLGKIEKEKDTLRAEVQSAHKDISDLRCQIDEMKQEEKRLRHTIHVAEMEISRQKKDIDNVMNERDILGTQLVRRNDELSLQYNRIKILNGTIHRGEAQYVQRLEDIRLLKLEVKKLRTEKALLSKSIANISDLRQEIFHLDRDLTREKLKVMALEEEVQNPLNIHRWRKLEGSDPETYELLKKIQILQKRILKMSSELIEKEKKIKSSEKLYMNLREILSKQPGPEVTIYLEKTQKALRERGKKMKCLVSELNMYECQVNEYKCDLEKVNAEMSSLKMKYYALKRKEEKSKESKPKDLSESVLPPVSSCHKKFTGGGFNMAAPTPRNSYTLNSADI